jgi:hypothetical protein
MVMIVNKRSVDDLADLWGKITQGAMSSPTLMVKVSSASKPGLSVFCLVQELGLMLHRWS